MGFIFEKLAFPLDKRFKICFESFFGCIPEQKTVSEVLKTWYFFICIFVGRPMGGHKLPNPSLRYWTWAIDLDPSIVKLIWT